MSCNQDYQDHKNEIITLNGERYIKLSKLVEEKFTSDNSDYTKCLESLKGICSLCDPNNPSHESIWRIANQHFA